MEILDYSKGTTKSNCLKTHFCSTGSYVEVFDDVLNLRNVCHAHLHTVPRKVKLRAKFKK